MLSKRIVREYFTFNKRERRGLFGLVLSLIVFTSVHLAFRLQPNQLSELTAEQKQAIDVLVSQAEAAKLADSERQSKRKSDAFERSESNSRFAETSSPKWETFDPNTASADFLKATGLKPFLADRIVKYRNSGGSFKDTKALARIHGMDSIWLKNAEPYLQFPHREISMSISDTSEIKRVEKTARMSISLNSADSATLVSIRGVGPFYAAQVIKLREELGGFWSFSQLEDVYRMRPETMEKLRESCYIDLTAIDQIPLNKATVEELAHHKYISWKVAKIIVAYRDSHGSYRKVEDILKTDVVTDSMYRKIAPYLSIE